MRKYKFRVWDKMRLQFIYPEDNNQQHFIIDLNGQFHNLQNGSGGDDYIVQEYTGLTDKNGKEIFEGDIVKWGSLNYIVEYNHTACKWQGRSPEHHGYLHLVTEHFRDLMNGIIISNIFEHKHLLEK